VRRRNAHPREFWAAAVRHRHQGYFPSHRAAPAHLALQRGFMPGEMANRLTATNRDGEPEQSGQVEKMRRDAGAVNNATETQGHFF
jgi:hypothetical protein